MGFKVNGVDSLVAKFSALSNRVGSSVASELRDIGDDLKDASQSVAPYRPGEGEHLRDQAYSNVDTGGTDRASVEVGYSGPHGYLLVQHEGGWENFMGQYGPKRIEHYTTPGTSSKFLERPWLAMKPGAKKRVRDAVQRGISG